MFGKILMIAALALIAWAVVARASGELLGSISLLDLGSAAEIGYWVKAEARGCGVATRALRLVSRYALEQEKRPRVQLTAEPENVGSQRVAEKAGFRREGVLRAWMEFKGRRRDAVMYSLLPQDLADL